MMAEGAERYYPGCGADCQNLRQQPVARCQAAACRLPVGIASDGLSSPDADWRIHFPRPSAARRSATAPLSYSMVVSAAVDPEINSSTSPAIRLISGVIAMISVPAVVEI